MQYKDQTLMWFLIVILIAFVISWVTSAYHSQVSIARVLYSDNMETALMNMHLLTLTVLLSGENKYHSPMSGLFSCDAEEMVLIIIFLPLSMQLQFLKQQSLELLLEPLLFFSWS